MRLRQICLVAPHLEPAVGDIAAIMGLTVCYRDAHLATYGLENAVMPVDTVFLEVVAPIQPGTAAARFLDKSKGHGGYMVIFACDDPDERGRNAEASGVRIANVIDHAPYHGVQLHPRDCRACFIEFNHAEGSDDVLGPYPPAGPDWQQAIRTDVTQALVAVELQSPDPASLAQLWSRLIGIPARKGAGDGHEIALTNAALGFVAGASDAMTAVTIRVRDIAQVRDAARSRGCPAAGDSFLLGGVTFRMVA
jgi:hypothetical protein